MKTQTIGNQVKLLLDGEEFFKELTFQLDRVIHAKPGKGTYVRLAFWEVDGNCEIDRSGRRTLSTMLHAAADAGHTVQIIYWKPSPLTGAILKKGWTLPPRIPTYQSKKVYPVGPNHESLRGSVQVYGEPHRGWSFGTANHQKVVLVAIDGVLTAIVGGMNLTNKSYALVTHDPRVQLKGLVGAAVAAGTEVGGTQNWHDTAVMITGPATAAVEEEWLRRWNKRRPSPRIAPVKAPVQAPIDGGHAVTILTTNSELRTREMHIREALCERIATAERYVYLENYVLSDPILVAALADRLRATKDLVVIFVAGKDTEPYAYMNRLTRLRLIIAAGGAATIRLEETGGSFSIKDNCLDPVVVGGDFSDPLRINHLELLKNPWGAKDAFRYTTPQGKKMQVPLGEIKAATSNRVLFAYPTHGAVKPIYMGFYVHSKLVLVDDDTAFIGSANFSYRSMVYDGEMCARIAGSAAKDIRVALFKHFDLDYADASAIQAAILSGALQASGNLKTRDLTRDCAFLRPCTDPDLSFDLPEAKYCNHTWH